MPREQINYPQLHVVHLDSSDGPDGGTDIDTIDPELHVSWMPDMHVQLALVADPKYFAFCADSVNEGSIFSTEEHKRSSAWTPVLKRQELNKLIRVLRRARDSAYGKDE